MADLDVSGSRGGSGGQPGPGLTIAAESPLGADLDLLFARHVADMHADTPPESIHMLPRAQLDDPAIAFLVMRDGGQPVGMGAVKRIAPGHGEIKSMHVLAEHRGRGLSRRLLGALIDHAGRAGLTRLSLETGVQPTFGAARRLYAAAGFRECGPFQGYGPDPNSVFMTLTLA
ncbi:GNAT family N-acetyltransferase [Paracoccus endophyticus]|uniref:GNAT family N-acetyltransferase n=1 Tax=Paracoccus endophyticus TaxID=2233774 RepID=UPI000DD663DB|nr:GNAT family N-acetyltransferase [Paracoccus endophyticus]